MKKSLILVAVLFAAITSNAQTSPQTGSSATTQNVNADGKVEVSTGRYITGGILGSTLGFGIGHGVQGRYAEKGWIFTAGEVAGAALWLPAAAQCGKDNKDKTNNDDKKCTSSQNNLIVAGLVVGLGFRIWEIVDVWTGATPVDAPTTAAFILPTSDSVQAGLVYRF